MRADAVPPPLGGSNELRILLSQIANEKDLVSVRRRARRIAELVKLPDRLRTSLATAVSEGCRVFLEEGGACRVQYSLRTGLEQGHDDLIVVVSSAKGGALIDHALRSWDEEHEAPAAGRSLYPGLDQTALSGLMAVKKLIPRSRLQRTTKGPALDLSIAFPHAMSESLAALADRIAAALARDMTAEPSDELRLQNEELIRVIAELERQQDVVESMNAELQDTNRGVIALMCELDEKAAAYKGAGEAKARFLSEATHELRTPVNSALSLTRLLLDAPPDACTPSQWERIRHVRTSIEGLSALVNDLLDLAKAEAGRIQIRLAPVDVVDLFGALRGMFKPLLMDNLTVSLRCVEDATIPMFVSDEGKLAQILRNFISNAVKFSEQGEITLTAQLEDPDHLLFSVRDEGIGIAPKDYARVFEDFGQVENRMQRHVQGTGLGLPLSRNLALVLGGEVWFTSAEGQGSTFFLRIPFKLPSLVPCESEPEVTLSEPTTPVGLGDPASGARAPDRQKIPVAPGGAGDAARLPTAVIIDDNEMARFLLHDVLAERFHVVETKEGLSGIAAVTDLKPAVVFLDLSMPGMSGEQVMAALQSNPETASIPVIIHSSSTPREIPQTSVLARAAGFLDKQHIGRETSLRDIERILSTCLPGHSRTETL